ncbi:MAG: ADP-ribose pyrophosphatase, partial [Candidatus Bathyarchaeia archaeon]
MDSSAAEEIVSSETLYRGRLINVKLVKVNISGKLYHREVVDHPGAVALIPILGEQIILIRQFRLAAGRFLYEV